MYQQRIKLDRISIVSLGLAILFMAVALIKGYFFLILIAQYCVASSLICDGSAALLGINKQEGIRLLILGLILFIVTTLLLFQNLTSH